MHCICMRSLSPSPHSHLIMQSKPGARSRSPGDSRAGQSRRPAGRPRAEHRGLDGRRGAPCLGSATGQQWSLTGQAAGRRERPPPTPQRTPDAASGSKKVARCGVRRKEEEDEDYRRGRPRRRPPRGGSGRRAGGDVTGRGMITYVVPGVLSRRAGRGRQWWAGLISGPVSGGLVARRCDGTGAPGVAGTMPAGDQHLAARLRCWATLARSLPRPAGCSGARLSSSSQEQGGHRAGAID